jgi:hypothetical protein
LKHDLSLLVLLVLLTLPKLLKLCFEVLQFLLYCWMVHVHALFLLDEPWGLSTL